MARKRHTPEQIIRKLREAEVELAKGLKKADVVRKLEITEQTYYRWRKEYGGRRAPRAGNDEEWPLFRAGSGARHLQVHAYAAGVSVIVAFGSSPR